MASFDSSSARAIAREMLLIRDSLEEGLHEYQYARAQIESFSGLTAEAMDETLGELISTAASLADSISQMKRKLSQYADELEQLDAQLSDEI